MPRRPRRTTIDPSSLADGKIAGQTGTWDVYFEDPVAAFRRVIGHMVDALDEPDRSCVQMTVMAGMTYEEAAELLEAELGRRVHRRSIHRWARRGLVEVRESLLETPWAGVFMEGRAGLPEGQVGVPDTLRLLPPLADQDTENEEETA